MSPADRKGKRPLRVLHGTYEIAGQGMVLAQGLRAVGADARSLAYRVDWDGRRPDIVVELDRLPGNLVRGAMMAVTFAHLAPAYDVFHFHFGTSFLPRLIDVSWLRAMGKTVVFHFHGCEVRNRAWMLEHHSLAACTECDPFCSPPRQRWLLGVAARNANGMFYSTRDLAESVPGGIELPLAIEADRWEEAGREYPLPDPLRRDGVNGPVVLVHAPTLPLIKGTRHVLAAVEILKAEFPLLELRLIEKRPWAEMPRVLAECDILVDQLFMGWYGLLAIEGMCVGKPVVCYLRSEFAASRPDCPVVSATPETVADTLRALVRDPARRLTLGERGRAFARAHHDAPVVGRTLLGHYQRLRGR
jgi:glycosyltransferase involved in cell wall biosynthesis